MIRRHLEDQVVAALADTPVTLLVGARQTGKSTLCQQLAVGRHRARYLTLDDATTLAAARTDPVGFVASIDSPVVIDEVQRAPDLFSAIKLAVDRKRTPGRFLLTGSANVLLLPRVSDSLVGRMQVLMLWPFSQGEIEGAREGFIDAVFGRKAPPLAAGRQSREDILGRALRGGYPEILTRSDPRRRRAWYESYVTTILQRDVRDLANIEGLASLPRLLALIASRATSLLNYADLSRGTALPQSTVKRYLALLENTFLTRAIPAWSANLGKRLVKAPRLAVGDTGLLAHLVGASPEKLRTDPGAAGPILENFVAMELIKQATWSSVAVALHHFRTAAGQEVDLVLERDDGKIVGIEVKAAASVAATDFRGLHALREAARDRFLRGIVLYTGREAMPFGPSLFALPASAIWETRAD